MREHAHRTRARQLARERGELGARRCSEQRGPSGRGQVTRVHAVAQDSGRDRCTAAAVVDDGAERDRRAGSCEAAVEALGELRPVVGSLSGDGHREQRGGRNSGSRRARRWKLWITVYLPVGSRMESHRRSTTDRERGCARDRIVYGRLTHAADPYGSRTCHAVAEDAPVARGGASPCAGHPGARAA